MASASLSVTVAVARFGGGVTSRPSWSSSTGSVKRVPTTAVMVGPVGATAWTVGVTAHAASPPAQTRKTVVARTTLGAQGTATVWPVARR
jgi:hypothetical protein